MAALKPETGPDGGFSAPAAGARIAALDVLRGVLVLAMIACHGAWDLWVFAWVETPVPRMQAWLVAVQLVAGGFLALAGANLVLAQRAGFRAAAFLRRLGLIAATAVAVSLATWFMDPSSFIHFGILHCIALGSVLAWPLLRAPLWLVAPVAAVFLLAGPALATPVFDGFAWYWLGLSSRVPESVDYIPLFPWFGVMLLGVLAGRWLSAQPVPAWRPRSAATRALAATGRWSLLIYLVHQPVLIGLLDLANMLSAPGTG